MKSKLRAKSSNGEPCQETGLGRRRMEDPHFTLLIHLFGEQAKGTISNICLLFSTPQKVPTSRTPGILPQLSF